jgi:hypothetical protein
MKRLTGALIAAAALGFAGAASPVNAEIINFDDLSANAFGTQIQNGYHGLDWQNFYVLNTGDYQTDFGTNGYTNNTGSSPNVAFNGFGGPSEVISAAHNFTVNSFDLGAAWNNGLTVVVEGLENGNIVDATDFVVNATGPATLEHLGWSNIDELTFFSFGGTSAGYDGSGEHFVLDNLNVVTSGVPEFSTWALFLAGVASIGAALRMRRRERFSPV